jgi:hypothetical protein
VINNSWRRAGADPGYYADVAAAWVAAGIFPVFGAGNDAQGGLCGTVGWPPSLADVYAVGNTDAQDRVNPSSSRGTRPTAGSSRTCPRRVRTSGPRCRPASTGR